MLPKLAETAQLDTAKL